MKKKLTLLPKVQFGDIRKTATSGGACPKYEISTASLPKLAKDAPNPFEARARLLKAYGDEAPTASTSTVAIPVTGPIGGFLPYLATLVRELGGSVMLLQSDTQSLAQGEHLCNSFDSCGPVKITHAICDITAPYLFFPKIMRFADREGPGGIACVTEQTMPEVIEQSLSARGRQVTVLRPRLDLDKGLETPAVVQNLQVLAETLGAPTEAIQAAISKAAAAQRDYETTLAQAGQDFVLSDR